MPELNVVFVLLPAEKNFPARNNRGEIDQAATHVFDLDIALLKFTQHLPDLG